MNDIISSTVKNHFAIKLFLGAIVLWFFLLSGNYQIAGVGIYPPFIFLLLSPLFFNSKLFFRLRIILLFGTVFLIVALLSLLIHQSENLITVIYFRVFIKSILIPVFAGVTIAGLFRGWRFTILDLSIIIVLVLLFQIILTIIQLTSSSFRELFFSMVELAPNWKLLAISGHFRATGLAGLSIYDTSICYALLSLLMWPLAKSRYKRHRLLFCMGIISVIVLCLISGRTGVILLIFSLLFLFKLCDWKSLLSLIFIFFFSFMCALVIYFVGYDELSFVLKFMLEPIISLIENGNVSSSSTSQLFNEYIFIPWDVNPFFGDGNWAQPSVSIYTNYQYKTDSGLLLFFIAFGPIGLVLCLCIFLIYLFYFKVIFFQHGRSYYVYGLFISFVLISIFLIIKAPFVLSERITSCLVFTIIFIHISNRYKGKVS